ncbi:MAG: hypothetical protein KF754_10765 [Planctomycetes bacterium]|nr:hypothetical protein [Planctomycetota bacterium]
MLQLEYPRRVHQGLGMGEVVKSQRVREINPDELDFDTTDAGQFDFDAQERRRYQRALLEVPIAIKLLGAGDKELCKGRAVLRDLSLDGAFLAGIEIEHTTDGVKPEEIGEFQRIQFVIMDGPFKGVEAAARPVRVGLTAGGVGVKLEAGFNFAV